MRFGAKRSITHTEPTNFDLLRVRIEQQVPVSSVIAITSATADDGKEVAARGLAHSLSMCGYSTLFIDTALASRPSTAPPQGLTLKAIGGATSPTESRDGRLAVMTLDEITLARTTSFRGMTTALDLLRRTFDYVVISSDLGMSTAFGVVLAAGADSVLVTVKTGRRKRDDDVRLATEIGRIGSRAFVGLVTLSPEVIASNTARSPAALATNSPRNMLARATGSACAVLPKLAGLLRAKRTAADEAPPALLPGTG